MIDVDWNKLATTTIKVELARSGIGYEELIRRLEEIGVHESYTGIAAKINRGTFSFAFFMQCMRALELKTIRLD
jgi:DNA (cytosine-5)-methyltransferase 1